MLPRMNLTWRSLTVSDAAQVTRVLAAVEAEDHTGENYGEEDITELLSNPVRDLVHGSRAVFDGETLAGYCFIDPRTTAEPVHQMRYSGTVHPAYRGRGIGGKLMAWSRTAAVLIHERHFPGRPLELHQGVDKKNTRHEELVVNAGYRPIRWFFDMQCELGVAAATAPVPDLLKGLSVVTFRSEFDEPLRLANNEAFQDHWGASPQTAEVWRHAITGSRAFVPELTYLALDDATGQVAGYLVAEHYQADTETTGIKELYIALIGTRRPWRRRGIATTLIAKSLGSAARQGYQRSSLTVDADNPTGALGVYQRAGFRQYQQSTAYALTILT